MLAAPVDDLLLGDLAYEGRLEHQERHHVFAALVVGHRDHAGLVHGWVLVQGVFHLGGPDLEARDVDHALEAVAHEEVTLFVHTGQVARAEESLAVQLEKGRLVGLVVLPITAHELRATGHQFTHLAHRQLAQGFRVDDARVHAGRDDAQALALAACRWIAHQK